MENNMDMIYQNEPNTQQNKWLGRSGSDSDIVVRTRVRLARNIDGIPFASHQSTEDAEHVVACCTKQLTELPALKDVFTIQKSSSLSDAERISLAERHLISPEFAKSSLPRAVCLSGDAGISVMINEEDHLRLQVMGDGLCINECLACAVELDQLIDAGLNTDGLHYAFDEKIGYLTHCSTNLGTGLRASVMLHLPALARNGRLKALLNAAGNLGLAIRGYYGEGSRESGDLYQVSNRITLGYTEQELCDNLCEIVSQIIQEERAARKALLETSRLHLEDRVCRSHAVLKSARLISAEEAMTLLSDERLGVSLNLLPGDIRTINVLIDEIQPATLCLNAAINANAEQRDETRASLLRERLA